MAVYNFVRCRYLLCDIVIIIVVGFISSCSKIIIIIVYPIICVSRCSRNATSKEDKKKSLEINNKVEGVCMKVKEMEQFLPCHAG